MDGSTTIVTKLYDLKHIHRFKRVLSIKCPMSIWISPNMKHEIHKYRPHDFQTNIIIQEFEDTEIKLLYQASIQNLYNSKYFIYLDHNAFGKETILDPMVAWPDPYK